MLAKIASGKVICLKDTAAGRQQKNTGLQEFQLMEKMLVIGGN